MIRLWLINVTSKALFAIAHACGWLEYRIGWAGRRIANKRWDGIDMSKVEVVWHPLDDVTPGGYARQIVAAQCGNEGRE